MRSLSWWAPALAAVVLPMLAAPAEAQERCEARREVSARLDASELTGVLVDAAAGSLEVVGVDVDEVRVRGVVCASEPDLAAESRLRVETRRGAGWVEVDLPEPRGWGTHYVRMDLVVEMPSRLPGDVSDGSGELSVAGIAAVRIDDGSGSIAVRDVPGAVEIEDGSGNVTVRGAGSLQLDDGSGDVVVERVAGVVHVVEDGSGGMEIRDVTGDVRIEEDGSGSITVERVGGDFILEDDGSGTLHFEDVRGAVRVPDSR